MHFHPPNVAPSDRDTTRHYNFILSPLTLVNFQYFQKTHIPDGHQGSLFLEEYLGNSPILSGTQRNRTGGRCYVQKRYDWKLGTVLDASSNQCPPASILLADAISFMNQFP